jgi:hypothetical protein
MTYSLAIQMKYPTPTTKDKVLMRRVDRMMKTVYGAVAKVDVQVARTVDVHVFANQHNFTCYCCMWFDESEWTKDEMDRMVEYVNLSSGFKVSRLSNQRFPVTIPS